jgi:AAHS family 4-hydroxybenzoate transporter-like MFS transporter
MGSNALLGAWLPSFFNQMAGVPISKFAVVIMIGFSGGLVGTLSAGVLMDRFAPTRLIPVTYLGLAIALFTLGNVPFGTLHFTLLIMFYSFCQSGGQAMLNTLQANSYPAQIRGTGIGWAGGMGRVGGILAPLLGGFMLAQHLQLSSTMLLAAMLPLGTALLLLGLPRKRPN